MSALVTTEWLGKALGEPGIKIVDGSWYLPAQKRDAELEYLTTHIPGAVRFDIDVISDQSSGLPHTIPSPQQFGEQVSALGLSNDDTIIVYDGIGFFSAPRVWWMLKTYGAHNVRVLDGGFNAWLKSDLPTESGPAELSAGHFISVVDPAAAKLIDDVKAALNDGSAEIVDARAADRFSGEAPEPRPNVKSGHMPGAKNLPFTLLIDDDGKLKSPDELRAAFLAADVDLDQPVITSCGSGVTAAVLTLAMAEFGKTDVSIYDGSWSEWGSREDTETVTGAA